MDGCLMRTYELGPQCLPSDHAPLSPQSSVASSGSGGSEHLEDQTTARNIPREGVGHERWVSAENHQAAGPSHDLESEG